MASACQSTPETTSEPTPQPPPIEPGPRTPTDEAPSDYDGYEAVQDQLFDGLERALEAYKIDTLHVPQPKIPTARELRRALEYPSATESWLPERMTNGHLPTYIGGKANTWRFQSIAAITRSGTRDVIEAQYQDELLDAIWQSQEISHDPRTALELGKFKSAKAALFIRVTATFRTLNKAHMIASRYWMRGNYQYEARLVLVEKGTTVWSNTLNWHKYFIMAPY